MRLYPRFIQNCLFTSPVPVSQTYNNPILLAPLAADSLYFLVCNKLLKIELLETIYCIVIKLGYMSFVLAAASAMNHLLIELFVEPTFIIGIV